MSRWVPAALLALVVLAASVKSYSLYMTTLDHPELMPSTIASGQARAPNQYRVLVPWLWRAATSAGTAPAATEQAIVIVSIVFCYASLAVSIYLSSRSLPVTALCLIAFYGAAASGFWFRNREFFFDVGFTACGMSLAVQERPAWTLYVLLSAIAPLNRETWLFSLVGAAAYRWANAASLRALLVRHRRDVFGLGAAGLVSLAAVVAVRVFYGPRPYHYPLWQFDNNVHTLLVAGSLRASLGQAVWLAGSGMFAVWAIFAIGRLARYVAFVAGFMASLLVVSFLIANWHETRIFASAFAVLVISISGGLAVRRPGESAL